ncbi:SEC-C metal-binding domain-containing protein [Pseudomonas aeruginosa]|uniref:SEC-C metal-binding domain-containing protein n=1 Tax=Pseudomonas aeruginosa TaxID=287 RepID=UPI000FC4341A|nr:SEC-C metal-binding domain-containing protein [Pseudomonas aeruginosa]MDP5541291.1 SEC-C metal-binding domain-containing protein [Pseudomonas aeruginosa]RUI28255.1 SEC-C domain-containing protein [Pseudomonas aeruginosa]
MSTRAPVELPKRVMDFCRTISPLPPVVLPVEAEPFALPAECYGNVEEQVRRSGGAIAFGWQIWDWAGVFTEAEFHAVWRSPAGTLHDITPKADGDSEIVFLPDPSRRYDGRRIDSIRRPASDNRVIGDFIRLCEANFFRFGQLKSGIKLDERDSDLYRSVDLARMFMVETIRRGANRNAPCNCGSGERYKRCHEPKLHKLIEALRE